MSNRQQQVLRSIEQAFQGVELGDGVSLHETVVIDDYGSREAREMARAPDEKRDWRKLIHDPELTEISGVGGVSFYDAAGLRFHLPAYLSLAVIDFDREDAGNALASLMFTLTQFSDYNRGRLAILEAPQRACVRDVLLYLRETYALDDPALDEAIEGYWNSAHAPNNQE